MATARPALLAGIVVLLVAAVLAAGAAGPARVAATPTVSADPAAAEKVRTQPAVTPTPAQAREARSPVRVELSGPKLVVGVLLVVLALAVGLARVLRQQWQPERSVERSMTSQPRPPPVSTDPRPVLAAAAEEALAALARAGAGESRDAVIRCWLSLEATADELGTTRLPAQTPTEFTAALLTRHRADRAAVTALLGLYHRARFGTRPLDDGAASGAAGALAAIASSLQPSPQSSKERSAP